MIVCNALIPQLFWFRKMRRNWIVLLSVSLLINLGMWLERYTIIVTSLSKDFLPSNWVSHTPTFIDVGVLSGPMDCLRQVVLLFMRYIPMMAISELKGVVHIGY